jgi:hypothetical protein
MIDTTTVRAFLDPRHHEMARELFEFVKSRIEPLPVPSDDAAARAQARELVATLAPWVRYAIPKPDLRACVMIREAQDEVRVKLRDLEAAAEGFLTPSAGGATRGLIRLDRVARVRTVGTVAIPASAVILLEGDRPKDHLFSVVIVGFLLAFAAVNLLALRRTA